jgi:CRP-like cAMP-binding protein
MDDSIDLQAKKAYIKKQPCFTPLTDQELDILATLFVEKPMRSGETVVTKGESVDSVYLIVSGTVEVRDVIVENGKIVTPKLAVLGPNEAIGLNEAGFYSLSGIRTATVVALTDVVLLRLSVTAFHGFALAYSHVNEIMRKNAKIMLQPATPNMKN